MKVIFESNLMNEDGRGFPLRTEYFEDEFDAKVFAFGKTGEKHPASQNTVKKINVWGLKEYSQEAVLRNQALAKLTPQEIKALGL